MLLAFAGSCWLLLLAASCLLLVLLPATASDRGKVLLLATDASYCCYLIKMSTSENTTADAETGSERPIALKRRSNGVGWNYGKLCDVTSKEKVKCDFFGHISTGRINRFKLHITGTTTGVLSCLRASPEAKAICQKALDDYEAKKVAKKKHKAKVRADVHVTALNESRELRESVCVGSTSSEPNKLGPMDKFMHPIDGKSSREEALR